MISHQRVANYAKALFDVPGTAEEIHQRQQHLQRVAALLTEHPEIVHLLGCPEVVAEKKLKVLEQVIEGPLNGTVRNLLAFIMQRGMANAIRKIANEYHKLVIYSLKEIEAKVVTAQPLTEQEREILRAKLEEKFQKKALIVETVDPSLLMGMTVLVHDQMIDLSAKGIFMNLKKQLLKAKV